jgi:hypothetical protein
MTSPRCVFLILLLGIQMTGWAADTKALQKVDSPDMRMAIRLKVQEGVDVGAGKPGFRLSLSGWPPGIVFDVYALAADGTRVPLVSGAMTDAAGTAVVAVPYESEGLHPGSWLVGVASKNLVRGERLLVPRVIHGKSSWRLDFKSLSQPPPAPGPH